MTDAKLTKYLLFALVVISTTMLIWTVNYVQMQGDTNIPTVISAYNG